MEISYVQRALKNVNEHYLEVFGLDENNVQYQQAAENAFAAELYHQLKSINVAAIEPGLIWHFDLQKGGAGIRPDLVWHRAPYNREDQRIYIEIKTNLEAGNNAIKNDLKKLKMAVSNDNGGNQLGFQFGIYIVGNINTNRILTLINEVFLQQDALLREKLWLMRFVGTDTDNLQTTCFAEI